MTIVAVIGLGEAGAHYARGLYEAGYEVRGFDPFQSLDEPGVQQPSALRDAVADAELVLSLVGAGAAETVALQAFPAMTPGAVFADMNTGSPALKRSLELTARQHRVSVTDIAVLAPVPRRGVRTPLMASGDGADRFAVLFAGTGAAVESIGGNAGDAASRKLIRSVFMKGMAAVMLESTAAARAAGCEPWLRAQMAAEFAGDPDALIQRMLDGSVQHSVRREHEMQDAADCLRALETPTWVTESSISWFGLLKAEAPTTTTNTKE